MDWRAKALTWQGHEFLDALRSDTVWRRVRTELKDRALSLPLSVIQQFATQIGASMVGVG